MEKINFNVEPKLIMCPYCKGRSNVEWEMPHPPKFLLKKALKNKRIAKRLMPHSEVCIHCNGTGRIN